MGPGRPMSGRPGPRGSDEVEPIEVHDLVPRGHEVTHELLLRVAARVDLRGGPQLGARAEDAIGGGGGRGSGHLEPKTRSPAVGVHRVSPVARSWTSYTFSSEADAFHSRPMSVRFTKKSLVNVSGRSVKT